MRYHDKILSSFKWKKLHINIKANVYTVNREICDLSMIPLASIIAVEESIIVKMKGWDIMRKKSISKTYMRGVTDWDFIVIKRKKENYYICIKRINEIEEPFIVDKFEKNKVFIDNGYYIVEFTPLGQFYNGRVYLDNNADVIGYYFDMSLGNGVEDNIPYYDDLYLDVIYRPNNNGVIECEDENELLDALNNGKITQKQYELAKNTCSNLIEEIQKNTNIFINMDKKELIQRYFK